jgi:hypothetical protein
VKHDTPVCTVILLNAILINIVAPTKNTFTAEKFYWKKLIFRHKNGNYKTMEADWVIVQRKLKPYSKYFIFFVFKE